VIYLCIPAHNEEQTVGVVLWKIRQVLAELGRDYQILVADDASTDKTAEVLEPYMRVLPLTVMRSDRQRGYAASLEMLLREADRRSDYPKRDALIVLQADFTEEPGHIAALVKRVESGADVVASNATHPRDATRAFRWSRAIATRLLRRVKWPEGVQDPLTGYNAYRLICIRKAIEEAGEQRLLRNEGWLANVELLRAAVPHARRVDVEDLLPRAERRQRPTRFHAMTLIKAAWAYARGRRTTPALSVPELQPATMHGERGSQRALAVESLREGVRHNGESDLPPGHRRSRDAAPRRGGSSSRPTRPARTNGGSGAGGGEKVAPKRAPARAAAAAQDPNAPESPPRRKRKRGGSRSSTRKRGNDSPASPETTGSSSSESAPAAAPDASASAQQADAAPGTAVGGQQTDAASNDGSGGTSEPRRRRRGSRGGRRRRKRPSESSGDAQQQSPSSGSDEADASS
jgi:dolichol-phosphate mannosyltransferase